MAYRQFEIEGENWTPLLDVAKETNRYDSVVRTYLKKSGGSAQLQRPAPYERRLLMMKSKDVPALMDLLKTVPRLSPKRHYRRIRREFPVANGEPGEVASVESGQQPTKSTVDDSMDFINTLKRLKGLSDKLGIKLDQLTFTPTGEAQFPRLKLEVIKL